MWAKVFFQKYLNRANTTRNVNITDGVPMTKSSVHIFTDGQAVRKKPRVKNLWVFHTDGPDDSYRWLGHRCIYDLNQPFDAHFIDDLAAGNINIILPTGVSMLLIARPSVNSAFWGRQKQLSVHSSNVVVKQPKYYRNKE
ncbi:hypothetical protein PIB30_065679 [Stylosanthes scabra]|uniref:Uncharacterized protein n=1 Tax=Stylosanthes scabra TaxID=79078 RepID=A0ABU6ZKT7_9FABA|nr:hypothetical protein [Stylosanthes scabra]